MRWGGLVEGERWWDGDLFSIIFFCTQGLRNKRHITSPKYLLLSEPNLKLLINIKGTYFFFLQCCHWRRWDDYNNSKKCSSAYLYTYICDFLYKSPTIPPEETLTRKTDFSLVYLMGKCLKSFSLCIYTCVCVPQFMGLDPISEIVSRISPPFSNKNFPCLSFPIHQPTYIPHQWQVKKALIKSFNSIIIQSGGGDVESSEVATYKNSIYSVTLTCTKL